MEFSKEFIEDQKLTTEQVTAINTNVKTHYDNEIATLKGEWDGKANKDAEAILDGAAKKIQEVTGLERDKGEKVGDFVTRSWGHFSEKGTKDLNAKIAEYDEKIKNAGTDETLKKELQSTKDLYSELQKKEAAFDELNGSGVKDKYDTLINEHSVLKLDVAFNSVKPSFPDTVNAYEADAKWDNFKKEILKENTLELVDGEWLAINKENKHKQAKLSDLISKDADITKLKEGRQQAGTGSKEKNLTDIEGVPFQIPEGANASERSKLIKDHLLSKGVNQTSNDYSTQFAALNEKIKNHSVAA